MANTSTQTELSRQGFDTALRLFNQGATEMLKSMALWCTEAFEMFSQAFDANGHLDPQWLQRVNSRCHELHLNLRLNACPEVEIPVHWVDDPTVLVLQATRTREGSSYDSTARFGIQRDGRIVIVTTPTFSF